jgi:PAS domain S-box-containing protein
MKLSITPIERVSTRLWTPISVLVGTLLLTGIAAFYVQKTTEVKDRDRFERSAEEISGAMDGRLEACVALLRAGTGLFAASHEVEPEEFRKFVATLDLSHHYSGIQGIGFSVRLLPDQKDRTVAAMRQNGFQDFKVWPEGDRPEYHSIIYLEPLDRRNRAAIGYDMFTEPVRRAAMEKARDGGLPVASGRVMLVQEIDAEKQEGFLIYAPVYRNDSAPTNVAERREALVGFVYAAFRAGDLLRATVANLEHKGISFQVYDGISPDANALLYDSRKQSAASSKFASLSTINVAGRPWTISYQSGPEFDAGSPLSLALMTLLGGGLISLLLFVITTSQTRARAIAERAVRELKQSEKSLRQSLHDKTTAESALRKSEESYRELFENANDIVYTLDLDYKLTSVNKAGELITGYRSAEVLGNSIITIVKPESIAIMREMMQRKMAGESRTNYEIEIQRKDGKIRTLEISSRLISENGKPVGIQGIARDITERKLGEEKLRLANQQALVEYEHLLERIASLAQALGAARELPAIFPALREFALASVPCDGLFVSLYDHDKDIRTAVYGWGDGNEINVSELPAMPVTAAGPNSRAVRTGEIVITDDYMTATSGHPQVIVGPDDGLRPQSSMAVPMSVLGRIIGTIEVQSYERGAYRQEHATAMRMAANLTAVAIENTQLLARESKSRAQAEESNRLKDEFLATVSHELRTPLTAILGWARMLDSEKLDDATAARAMQTILRNAKAQAQIIDDILDVSRIVTGNLQLNLEPTDLAPVIEAAVNVVKPTAEAKKISIVTKFDAQPAVVSGDAHRLQQIVWNLLSNAIKFTSERGWVQVELHEVDSHVEIKVSDNGQGISAGFLPYVFERFRQADSSTARTYGGLGLGLAIARHLVEIHGGQVSAQSEGEGKGATFIVRLPALRVKAHADSLDESRQSDSFRQQPSLNGINVLLVDDDAETLEMISAVLRERQASVTAVRSASEALSAIEGSKPDVLVSDIAMPEQDGYELIEKLRSLESGKDIPALAITAYAGAPDRARALDAGYQRYLPKPIEPAELVAVVASLAGNGA